MAGLNSWCFLCVACSGSIACAQGTLTLSDQKAEAEALYVQGGQVSNSGVSQDLLGGDFYAIEDRPLFGGGFDGRGYAEHGATFTPSSPLIGGAFTSLIMDACSSAEVFQSNIGPNSYEAAHGLASGVIEFTVGAPMNWTLVGLTQGTSFNTGSYNSVSGSVELFDITSSLSIFSQSDTSVNGVGDWVTPFATGGVLAPGSYRLSWHHESLVEGGQTSNGFFPTAFGGAPLVSCINSTFTLAPVPAPSGLTAIIGAGWIGARRRRRS